MEEHLQKTIQAFQKKLDAAQDEVIRLKRSINDVCEIGGESPIYADADLVTEEAKTLQFANDEFYGQPLATCAKKILEHIKATGGGATSINDLYEILVEGGYHFEGKEENRKTILRTALRKNSDFHKLPNNNYGLRAWYKTVKGSASDDSDSDEDQDEKNQTPDKTEEETGDQQAEYDDSEIPF